MDGDSNEIKIRTANGELISPSAIDIWAAEFDMETAIAGLSVKPPSTELESIEFASESPDLKLVLAQKPNHSLAAVLQLGNSENYIHKIPMSDQILHDGWWYCLDEEQVLAVKSTLLESQIELNEDLTSGQVLNLTWKKGLQTSQTDLNTINYTSGKSIELKSIEATLYEYQVVGVNRIIDLYYQGIGTLLADEMGLGKTLQVISAIAYLKDEGQALVVCPASTLANWKREIQKFAPTLSVRIHQGTNRAGAAKYLKSVNVLLTSYETMNQDVFVLRGIKWNIVAFDEAQYLKNPHAARTKSAKMITSRGKIAITGTPIENSLKDLWSITEILAPGYLPKLDEFVEYYPDEDWAAHIAGQNIAPITIRRSVAEVATSLPERVDTFVPIRMGEKQSSSYQEILDSEGSTFSKITKLRTLSASLEIENAKIEYLFNSIHGALGSGKKILIFASFTSTINNLKSKILENFKSVNVSIINGNIKINDRQMIIDSFTNDPAGAVLILNPRAAGVGLNIQAANYVFHFTPEWNPAIVDQASARAYRTGQQQTVFVYYLYFSDTVEEIMIQRLERKRSLQERGLQGASEGPTTRETELIMSLRPGRSQNGED